MRDEAHRFAITYHRRLRAKKITRSLLDEIEGIGEKRKKLLLAAFQSLEELRDTPVEILSRMQGMNHQTAERVHDFLRASKL